MTIKAYERSVRSDICERLLLECPLTKKFERIIILPIPTSRDGEHIGGSDMTVREAVAGAGADTLVVGYGIPTVISEELLRRGSVVCDSLLDEEFLTENARLTAVGAVGVILTTETRAPSDMRIGVVGYGRIGKQLTRIFIYLGASLTVFTSRESVRLELCECGVEAKMSLADAELGELDLLVNTAPAHIFDTTEGGMFPSSLRVIDLASGVNFPGIGTVEKYPSLPARRFPHSAGRAWFNSVRRYLLGGESFTSGV